MEKNREKYMRAAIREAKKAYALEEVPIGCRDCVSGQNHSERL